jgi:amino acid transporter
MTRESQLKRIVTLPFLVLYGLGTMVGGGFYALVGKVAGEAALFAPVALLCSGVLALLSGLAIAELASRFPDSSGPVRYIKEGFGRDWLARTVGVLMILTGVVSAAALAVATVGFLQDFVVVPEKPAIALLVLGMGAVAAWGIGKSVAVVTVITLIEVGALLYAGVVAEADLVDVARQWREFVPPLEATAWVGIFSGAFLAFYAFIGFEDMATMAEEVKDARRTLPRAIVISLLLSIVLYVLVSMIAVASVGPATLAGSNTPVAAMVQGHSWYSTTGLGIVSLLTGLNGALVQIIMASRVVYGMARDADAPAPAWLAKVSPRTRTPLRATALITAVIMLLAVLFPLTTLAKVTSAIILVVFGTLNVALWAIKRRDPDREGTGLRLPLWLPVVGALSSAAVLVFQLWLVIARG